MEIYTTGFTKKSARQFFSELSDHRIRRLVDVRINNTSQLSAFAKRDDLEFFLEELVGAEYVHEPRLAPTPDLLKSYRSGELSWIEYERRFLDLMVQRKIESQIPPELFAVPTVLLCSELKADKCHRRLVVGYLADHWDGITAVHI